MLLQTSLSGSGEQYDLIQNQKQIRQYVKQFSTKLNQKCVAQKIQCFFIDLLIIEQKKIQDQLVTHQISLQKNQKLDNNIAKEEAQKQMLREIWHWSTYLGFEKQRTKIQDLIRKQKRKFQVEIVWKESQFYKATQKLYINKKSVNLGDQLREQLIQTSKNMKKQKELFKYEFQKLQKQLKPNQLNQQIINKFIYLIYKSDLEIIEKIEIFQNLLKVQIYKNIKQFQVQSENLFKEIKFKKINQQMYNKICQCYNQFKQFRQVSKEQVLISFTKLQQNVVDLLKDKCSQQQIRQYFYKQNCLHYNYFMMENQLFDKKSYTKQKQALKNQFLKIQFRKIYNKISTFIQNKTKYRAYLFVKFEKDRQIQSKKYVQSFITIMNNYLNNDEFKITWFYNNLENLQFPHYVFQEQSQQ